MISVIDIPLPVQLESDSVANAANDVWARGKDDCAKESELYLTENDDGAILDVLECLARRNGRDKYDHIILSGLLARFAFQYNSIEPPF